MKFEYKFSSLYEKELEIEDWGNCAIEAQFVDYSGNVSYSYLIIRTELGITSIFEYGPIMPDIQLFPKQVSNTFTRFEFSEHKIITRIEKFLLKAENAELIEAQTALSRCRSIIEYFSDERNY